MTNAPTLSLKQAPTLALNAALLQAIQLMPMTRPELVARIRQELMDNPMLEEVTVEAEGDTPPEADDDASFSDATDHVTEGAELDEMNWAVYVPDDWEWRGLPGGANEERQTFEPTVRTVTTLQDHLLLQLLTATGDAEERRVGVFLIGNLDEAGYLRCSIDDVMGSTQADRAAVERVLATIQTFDPAGVGGRDLRECLVIQVRALGSEGTLLDTIVTDHLPTIQAQDLGPVAAKQLAKRLHLPPEEVAQALRRLRTFDPAPGLRFANEPAEAIVPDVIVRQVGQDYQVVLNDEGLPRLRLNTTYRRLAARGPA
jgi:RNA polymerase sigma-54 factor